MAGKGKGRAPFFVLLIKQKVLFLFCLKNKMEFDGC